MAHAQLVDNITDGFPYPSLPNQPGKPSYRSIRDTYCLLTVNVASIKSSHGRGQKSHLGLILTTTQYALIYQVPFFCSNDPGHTPNIPLWTTPFDEKALLCKHTKQPRQYDGCRNVDAALRNQLLTAFDNTYLSLLKNAFTGYSGATMIQLLIHLYAHSTKILATDLAENEKKLREAYNPDKPLKKPLHEAEQVCGLRNRGGRANHRIASRPHRLQPCRGNGAITGILQNLASQVGSGKDLDNVPGTLHCSAGLPARTT